LVDKIIAQKQKGESTADNEKLIDIIFYELYHVTKGEIELIKASK